MAPRGEVILRPATAEDISSIAPIWHRGWQDGHVGHVPEQLTAARTEQSFRSRAAQRLPDTTIAEIEGAVAGFVMVVGDEVEQVYVGEDYRGSGVANVLLAEAERRVRHSGHDDAWLAVVAGNERARRFYAKHGWGELDLQQPVVHPRRRRGYPGPERRRAREHDEHSQRHRVLSLPTADRLSMGRSVRNRARGLGLRLVWRPRIGEAVLRRRRGEGARAQTEATGSPRRPTRAPD